MNHTRFEIEWYSHLIQTALEHHDDVISFDCPDEVIDVILTVEENTDDIRKFRVFFDLRIVNVKIDDKGRLSVTLFTKENWNPVRPDLVDLDDHETFYHLLADVFGGRPESYQLDQPRAAEDFRELRRSVIELYNDDRISREDVEEYTTIDVDEYDIN